MLAPFLSTLEPADPLVTVTEAHYADAVRQLGAEKDLAILAGPPPRRLASLRVAQLPVWAYVAAGHRWAGRTDVGLEELADETLILLDDGFRPRRLLDEAMVGAALAPLDLIECGNPQVAQALAAAGRGVAVVSDDPRFDLAPMRIRTGADSFLQLTLHAAWQSDHHAAPSLRALAERLQVYCADRYPPQ